MLGITLIAPSGKLASGRVESGVHVAQQLDAHPLVALLRDALLSHNFGFSLKMPSMRFLSVVSSLPSTLRSKLEINACFLW